MWQTNSVAFGRENYLHRRDLASSGGYFFANTRRPLSPKKPPGTATAQVAA